jgi:hypothetical protein
VVRKLLGISDVRTHWDWFGRTLLIRALDLPSDQVAEGAPKRASDEWDRFLLYAVARETERPKCVLEPLESFYGAPLENVEEERFFLQPDQFEALVEPLQQYYLWPDLYPVGPDDVSAFPLLSAPPNVNWMKAGSPLSLISHSFTLYLRRFALHDPLAALASGWPAAGEVTRPDDVRLLVSTEDFGRYVARSIVMIRDLAPLLRSDDVRLLNPRAGEFHDVELIDRLVGDQFELPVGADISHVLQLNGWDDFALAKGLAGVAGDRICYELLESSMSDVARSVPTRSARGDRRSSSGSRCRGLS